MPPYVHDKFICRFVQAQPTWTHWSFPFVGRWLLAKMKGCNAGSAWHEIVKVVELPWNTRLWHDFFVVSRGRKAFFMLVLFFNGCHGSIRWLAEWCHWLLVPSCACIITAARAIWEWRANQRHCWGWRSVERGTVAAWQHNPQVASIDSATRLMY